MRIAGFGVEEWLNQYEKTATTDISQSTIKALRMDEILALAGQKGEQFYPTLSQTKLDYGWIEGSPEFKKLVAATYQHVPADNILQTNGATGANHLAIYSLLEPHDHVIALYPSYQQLYDIPRSFGVTVDYWRIHESQQWLPDLDELATLIRPNTKMILLNNAINPTGSVLDEDLLRGVVKLARKVGAYVLVDEVYQPLDGTPFVSIADLYEKGIATNSLSKTYSAPGVRIGWTATQSKEICDIFRKYRDYTMICGGVFNDQLAVLMLGVRSQILARNQEIIARNYKLYLDWVAQEPLVELVPPKAVPVSLIKFLIPEDDETFCRRLLADQGVLLVPGSRFDLPGHARLGYCTDTETLTRGLTLLSQALRRFD